MPSEQPASPKDDDSPPSPPPIGPHPGYISSSNQYTSELNVRKLLKNNGCDPAREDSYRIQGVQLIDNVREYMQLPVRTFDTACTYFHKFRLNFRDAEYNYQDAALASLFVACKVEDTIKKSKDVLAAAYNVKNPDKPVAADDKIFENPGKIIIGLERLILETIGFDFRNRYPQKLLVKVVRSIFGTDDAAKCFFATSYALCTDMYKTFVPIKRTTFSMVMAVVELTARMTGTQDQVDAVRAYADAKPNYHRGAVVETMLDVLDLYIQHHKATKLGASVDLNAIIDIKIRLNNDLDRDFAPRYLFDCTKCTLAGPQQPPTPASSASAMSPGDVSRRRTARGQEGTMRFVFDAEAAMFEKDAAKKYFEEEFEEYEIEVEEPVPPPPTPPQHEGGGRGGYKGGRDRNDHRRGGPYGGYRGDRHYRGRGRHY